MRTRRPVPWLGLASVTCPWCNSTARCTMANPRPVPVVCDPSSRVNRSKARALTLEGSGLEGLAHARAIVLHFKEGAKTPNAQAKRDGTSLRSVSDGVLHQIVEGRPQNSAIALANQVLRTFHAQVLALGQSQRKNERGAVPGEGSEIHEAMHGLRLYGFQPSYGEQLAHEPRGALDAPFQLPRDGLTLRGVVSAPPRWPHAAWRPPPPSRHEPEC